MVCYKADGVNRLAGGSGGNEYFFAEKVFFKCDYDFDYEPSRDILQIFSTNNKADAYNAQCFAEIETEPFEYISKDELFIYNREQEAVTINLDSSEADKLSEYDANCVKINYKYKNETKFV